MNTDDIGKDLSSVQTLLTKQVCILLLKQVSEFIPHLVDELVPNYFCVFANFNKTFSCLCGNAKLAITLSGTESQCEKSLKT